MRGRINLEGTNVVLSAIIDYKERLLAAKRFVIVACGTSWHAALIGKHLIESFCRIPVEVEYASEFRYRDPVIDSSDVVIAISQSGETADTLAAIELAKSRGAFIYGICNAIGSSIPRATNTGSYIHVGPEIGVASTKAFTGQVTVLTMLALTLAREKRTIDETQYLAIVRELGQIPRKDERGAEAERPYSGAFQNLHLRTQFYLSGTRLQLSRSVGRRFEAERNLVHPCGRLSGRRNEAWAYCFDRCGNAGGGYCHTERIVRKSTEQYTGN